jgi:hypothetical protein
MSIKGSWCYACGEQLYSERGGGCLDAPLICESCRREKPRCKPDGTLERSKLDGVRQALDDHLKVHRDRGDFDNLELDRYTAVWGSKWDELLGRLDEGETI